MSKSENIFGVTGRVQALKQLAIDMEKVQKRPAGKGMTDMEALRGKQLTKEFSISNGEIIQELNRRNALRQRFSVN